MIVIRTASFNDIETIRQLADTIWRESYAEILTPNQINYMLNRMYSSQTIEKELNEGVNWEIVLDNEKPIGFISTTTEGATIKLNKLYINPSFHGKGIGQRALDHVKEAGKQNGFTSIYLTVNKRNFKAMKAYKKAGFIRTDSKVFDIGEGYVMDDFIYTYNLD